MILRSGRNWVDEGPQVSKEMLLGYIPGPVIDLMSLCQSYFFVTHAALMRVYGTLIQLSDAVVEELSCFAIASTVARPDDVTAPRQDVAIAGFALKANCREAAAILC